MNFSNLSLNMASNEAAKAARRSVPVYSNFVGWPMVRCPNNIRLVHLMHNLLPPCPVCRSLGPPTKEAGRGSLTSSEADKRWCGCIGLFVPCPLRNSNQWHCAPANNPVTYGVLQIFGFSRESIPPTVTTPDWHNLPISFPEKSSGLLPNGEWKQECSAAFTEWSQYTSKLSL